jgi:hypothetical protein
VGNAIVVWRKCPCNILPQLQHHSVALKQAPHPAPWAVPAHTPFLRCRPPPPRTHTQTPLSQQNHDTPLLTRPNNHPFHDESASPRHIHVFIAAHVFGTHLVVIVTHFSALMSGPAARAIRAPFAHMTSFARPRSHTAPPHLIAPHSDPPPPIKNTLNPSDPPFTNPHFAPGGLRRSFSLPYSVGRQQAP